MSQISKDIRTLRCIITGQAGCGKTSLIQSLLTGGFDQNYKPTRSAEECRLTFYTNRGPICFQVLEAPTGQEQQYDHVRCAIIMYDVSSAASYDAVPRLAKDLLCIRPNIPMAICASKFDLFTDNSRLWDSHAELLVSVKLRYNLEKPFLWLAQEIFGDPILRMVPMPARAPPYAPIAKDQLHRMLKELPLPPNEDDDDY